MEKDGRTARPRDFSSPEAYRVSRRAFKKLIDTPALTKMTVLLAKNNEMKIHTAAHIAALYDRCLCQFDRSEACKTIQSDSVRIFFF